MSDSTVRRNFSDHIISIFRAPAWVWMLALTPRLVLAVLAVGHPEFLRGDALNYWQLAQNLIHHQAFSSSPLPPFLPNTLRTPGYPLFLTFFAFFRLPFWILGFFQGLLGSATAAYVWAWLNGLWGRKAAAVGAVIMAVDPVILFHTPLLLSEALFVFCTVFALRFTWDAIAHPSFKNASQSGFFWMLSAFIRPVSFYLPLVLFWIWNADKKKLAVFLISFYLLPAAWVLRNKIETGYAVFSSLPSADLLRYPAAGIESLLSGKPMGDCDIELRAKIDELHPNGYSSDAEMGHVYAQAGFAIVKAHPLLLACYGLAGAAKTLGGTGLEMLLEYIEKDSANLSGENHAAFSGSGTLALLRSYPFLIPLEFSYLLALAMLYFLSIAGLIRLWRHHLKKQACLLILASAYFLACASTEGYYRYRIPLMLFLSVLSAAAFVNWETVS